MLALPGACPAAAASLQHAQAHLVVAAEAALPVAHCAPRLQRARKPNNGQLVGTAAAGAAAPPPRLQRGGGSAASVCAQSAMQRAATLWWFPGTQTRVRLALAGLFLGDPRATPPRLRRFCQSFCTHSAHALPPLTASPAALLCLPPLGIARVKGGRRGGEPTSGSLFSREMVLACRS